jgi:hypothetical protein
VVPLLKIGLGLWQVILH